MEKSYVGQRIKARAKSLRIGPTELGRLINTSRQNVYGIYERRSINTSLLKKISEALDFDFFARYTDKVEGKGDSESPTMAMLYEDLQLMRDEIDKLRNQGDENLEDTVSKLYKDIKTMRNEINELKVKYKSIEKGNK